MLANSSILLPSEGGLSFLSSWRWPGLGTRLQAEVALMTSEACHRRWQNPGLAPTLCLWYVPWNPANQALKKPSSDVERPCVGVLATAPAKVPGSSQHQLPYRAWASFLMIPAPSWHWVEQRPATHTDHYQSYKLMCKSNVFNPQLLDVCYD